MCSSDLLTGLGAAEAGEVLWRGEPLSSVRETYARDMVYVGHSAALKDDLSALENLRVSMLLAGRAVTLAVARRALTEFGLEECLKLPARLMSQGQRRRAVLARVALSADAPLWILDEPFTALDVASVDRTRDLIVEHLADGGMVTLTTHQDVPITAPLTVPLELGA